VGLLAYGGEQTEVGRGGLVQVLPNAGSAHMWPVLNALAPVTAGDLPLASLLSSSRNRIGRRSTVTVITPLSRSEEGAAVEDRNEEVQGGWVAELVHLKSVGVDCSVLLVAAADADASAGAGIQALLARLDIRSSLMVAGAPLPALLTFRRRRRIVRTTPTGGVVSYEVDEEVG
jgi:hypothetical protein